MPPSAATGLYAELVAFEPGIGTPLRSHWNVSGAVPPATTPTVVVLTGTAAAKRIAP